MVKPELNLKEPDQALMRLNVIEARAHFEKKRDTDATPRFSGPPANAALAKDFQVAVLLRSH